MRYIYSIGLYYDFETCWAPAKDNCSSTDKRHFQAMELVYKWWCKDLFKGGRMDGRVDGW